MTMITNPNHLAAALMELAETNRPSMCSWVSARLREIADNLDSLGCPECGESDCCCADLFDGWEPLP